MRWKALLFLIAVMLFVVGCSGGRAGRQDISTTSVESNASDGNSETQKKGDSQSVSPSVKGDTDSGTLVRLWGDPPSLDPHVTTDATSATILVEVFGGLVTIDPELNIIPDLAESWDISPDGKTYTFRLRKEAKFHNGKAVTAEDVKWSLERATDPSTESPVVDQYLGDIVGVKEKLRGQAQETSGVNVIDEHTIDITIDAPKSYFLAKLTYPTGFVLDKENVQTGRRWFRTPNGTGPFKLTEYVPGETMVLDRNEFYHLGPPMLDSVRFILSGGTSMLMYENDEIHLTGVGLADLDQLLDPNNPLNPELQRAPPQFSIDYIGMNVNEPPFDDTKVRLALNYAIDRDEIARIVLADQVIPARGILPPGLPGYNPNVSGYEFNPTKAQQLLRESKYGEALANGRFPRIILTTAGSFGAAVGLDLEVILQMWEEHLGITVEIQQTEFATYLQDLNRHRFQMFNIGWIADYPDPENFLDVLFHGDSSTNHTRYNNAQVDAILEKARVEQDQELRYRFYHQAEQLILDDPPWVPLWNSGEQYLLIKPYIKGYALTPLIVPKLRFVTFTNK